jgi:hypothetical protein
VLANGLPHQNLHPSRRRSAFDAPVGSQESLEVKKRMRARSETAFRTPHPGLKPRPAGSGRRLPGVERTVTIEPGREHDRVGADINHSNPGLTVSPGPLVPPVGAWNLARARHRLELIIRPGSRGRYRQRHVSALYFRREVSIEAACRVHVDLRISGDRSPVPRLRLAHKNRKQSGNDQ